MDKFVTRKSRVPAEVDHNAGVGSEDPQVQPADHDQPPVTAAKRPRLSNKSTQGSQTERMRLYKTNLKYNPEWEAKWHWMDSCCDICEYDPDRISFMNVFVKY